MKAFIRNLFALFVGLLAGSAINMLIVTVGPAVIPPPAGVDVNDIDSIRQFMHRYQPIHFLAPFLAHAFGTLVGACIAYLIAVSYRQLVAGLIGGLFLLGGISVAMMLPAPVWVTALDLLLAYLPMAWLGIRLGQRFRQT